jgi:hypothetical protein
MKEIVTLDKANQPYGFPQLDANGNLGYKVYTILLSQIIRILGGRNPTAPLVVGNKYWIGGLQEGDDFSNVGFVTNGVPFISTGTTPTIWTNDTEVIDIANSQPTITTLQDNITGINVYFDYILIGIGEESIYRPYILFEKTGEFLINKTYYSSLLQRVSNDQIQTRSGENNLYIPMEIRVYN